MANWAFLVASSLLLCQTSLGNECCPPLWTQYGNDCYRFIGNPQSWAIAENQCVSLGSTVGKEGHLVSIHSNGENEFIHKMWKSSLTPTETGGDAVNSGNSLWLGINDQNNDEVFKWSDQSDISFTFWRENEPSAGAEEDCGHMWTYGGDDSNWNDAICDIRLPFVCKLDPNSIMFGIQQVEQKFQTSHVCEHETLHLECGPNQGITILAANFGRLDRNICSNNPWNTDTDSCRLNTSLSIVQANCEKFQSCDVAATYNVFGNPCGNVFKYLEVSYTCSDRINTKALACENHNLHLECDEGKVLSIESANFGRTNKDVCSNNDLDTNTDTCRIYNTLSIVQANCDDLRSCDVAATITTFGNPCPNIFKYLEVTHSCKKSTSVRAYACEHETLHLECPEGESVSIKSANYGRLHRNVCSNNGWDKNTDSCRSDTAMSIVRQTCDNYRFCDVPATNEKFGNPCGSIYKYLEVEYSCDVVDHTKLQSQYVCEHETLHLECGQGQGISILSANYGRLNRVICSDNSWNTDSDTCYSSTALGILRSNCETFQVCDVGATNTVFGNPCGNVYKYAEVIYVCQEREILRRHACEQDTLHLECGEGEVLAIDYANYGRTDRDVCSNNEYNKAADTCRTYNTQYIVDANCKDRRFCDVPATNLIFGNPCGNVYKYLDVMYKCQANAIVREYACENETLHLECSEGTVLSIQTANYGRHHRNVCANNPQFNTNTHFCHGNNTLSIARAKCDDMATCDLLATNDEFGNSCPEFYKYLEVYYTCRDKLKSPLLQ